MIELKVYMIRSKERGRDRQKTEDQKQNKTKGLLGKYMCCD